MRFHYEYLLPRFDGKKNLTELKLSKEQHSSIDLVDYIVKWDEYEVDENDQRIPSKKSNNKKTRKEEERYMAEQVAAIDSVSLDTNIKPTLREQLGESVFEEFFWRLIKIICQRMKKKNYQLLQMKINYATSVTQNIGLI